MRTICTLGAVAALVAAASTPARASCTIALQGDPSLTAPLADALAQFGNDASPCVSLQVTVRWDGDAIWIELHDDHYQRAERQFASVDGAAAFLISWSRRPLADGAAGDAVTGASPVAAAEPAPPDIAPASAPGDPETAVHYAFLLGAPVPAYSLAVTRLHRDGHWHYGGDLDLFAATPGDHVNSFVDHGSLRQGTFWLGGIASAVAGANVELGRFALRIEGYAGVTLAVQETSVEDTQDSSGDSTSREPAFTGRQLSFSTLGITSGVRGGVELRVTDHLGIEATAGFAVLWQSGLYTDRSLFGSADTVATPFAALGVVWRL